MQISSILRDLRFSTAVVLGLAGIASFALGNSGDLECSIQQVLTFSPPLEPGATTSVSMTGDLTGCFSPNRVFSFLQAGHYKGDGQTTATAGDNPCAVKIEMTYKSHIKWVPEEQSSIESSSTLDLAEGGVFFPGTVVADLLEGDTIQTAAHAEPNHDCKTAGLKTLHLTGRMVME